MTENLTSTLKHLSSKLAADNKAKFSFKGLTEELNITKEELDGQLIELEKGRYIDQYILSGYDDFGISITQKGNDAINKTQ